MKIYLSIDSSRLSRRLMVINKINDYLLEKGIFGNIDQISKF